MRIRSTLTCLPGALVALSLIHGLLAQEEAPETKAPPSDAPPPPPSAPAGPPNTGRALYESIVRIEATSLEPDYKNPWNAGRQSGGTGTGFLIGENKFMTNAHVVSNNTQVLIKKYGDPQKYTARLLHIAHDCDLALLELEDPAPFTGVQPLEMGDIPKLESTVTVIGYPMGGRRLSTTRGVVSRIDFQPYSHSGADLHLTIQIDAAINPGNSGGPVMQNEKVVGVAFQGIPGTQNVGYMIPTPVVRRFLEDVEDRRYDNYVDLSVGNFDLINPAYRRALGVPGERLGTLVSSVVGEGSADGVLQEGDVLLAIDDLPIASNGFVEFNGELVDMTEIVERKFKGDTVKLKIWRDKKEMEIECELKPFQHYRMQSKLYDEKPRYVFFAGFVLQPMDRNLMSVHRIRDLQARYLYTQYVTEEVFREYPEIVVLTTILPDSINSNYGRFRGTVVEKINGLKIRTLKDAYTALNPETLPEFFVIECLGRGMPLVIEGSRVREANERIMKTYRVGADHYLGEEDEAESDKEVPAVAPVSAS